MSRLTAWMMAPILILAFSPLQAHDVRLTEWLKYQDPRSLRGLHTKPVEVRYGTRTIYVNGTSMSEASAIRMLRMSRDLSPVPDILVYIRGKSFESSRRFLISISDDGLCEDARCWFKFEKP